MECDCEFTCVHVCRLVSSLPLRMTDPAVKRVVRDIIRSPEDKRVYRGLEFTNGLRALLISDPTTDKSSAAMDVQIGNTFIRVDVFVFSPFTLAESSMYFVCFYLLYIYIYIYN